MSILDQEATFAQRSERLPLELSWSYRIATLNGRDMHALLFAGILAILSMNILNDLSGRPYWPITRAIDVGQEGNIATWFSSMLWLSAASMAFLSYRISTVKCIAPTIGWLLLSVLLFYAALDEGAEIHEYLGSTLVKFIAQTDGANGVTFFGLNWNEPFWFLVLGPLAVGGFITAIFYFKAYFPASNTSRILVLSGSLIVLIGALGIEALNSTLLQSLSPHHAIRHIMGLLEEGLEMAGAWMVSYGLLLQKQHLSSV